MRGSVARRLRKIADSFGFPEEATYLPGGKLRRRGGPDGPLIRRPFVMRACWRLVYKQAKQQFKGKPLSMLAPEPEQKAPEQPQEFRDKVAESARTYASQD
jgi:hypothetical protein